ncbi:hypothetical protein DM860_006861 [Cuscuta australis]|uniref:Uncharacterized protein n=1 Tax=Cuscuta australis TaxID=267555 RepID=A0A328E9A0_9ASTE|nr:hypothetical protein DM860_006861 [Cuscuta australis]
MWPYRALDDQNLFPHSVHGPGGSCCVDGDFLAAPVVVGGYLGLLLTFCSGGCMLKGTAPATICKDGGAAAAALSSMGRAAAAGGTGGVKLLLFMFMVAVDSNWSDLQRI